MKTIKFINKAKTIHGDRYDYSLVNYIKSNQKIKIICLIHGEFEQRASNHLQGNLCPKCSRLNTIEYFINKSNLKHGYKYDYSLVEYKGNNRKTKIICPIHGEFEQTPNNHMGGKGCQSCNQSKGEREIKMFLINEKIDFTQQKRFSECKNKYTLPFDFFLPDYNACIEFNGRQHYIPIPKWGGSEELINIQIRDKIKSEYCKDNAINLIVIKYDEDIIEKLTNYLFPIYS